MLYLVEFGVDGGNVYAHEGYVVWSPMASPGDGPDRGEPW